MTPTPKARLRVADPLSPEETHTETKQAGKPASHLDRRTVFSECRLFRYTLWRQWDLTNSTYVMFIGLNPSTADEKLDDPTIRRCIQYAKDWGFGALCMTNLFAYRATEPIKMKSYPNPVGPENDRWLVACAREAGVVVAAWGNNGQFLGRNEEVMNLLDHLHCLRITKERQPEHPLYLPKNAVPVPFEHEL